MNTKDFAKKMNRASKNVLKLLLPALGLRKRVERALYLRYVQEVNMYDIAEELGMSYESFSNYLCVARAEMLNVIEQDYDIVSDDTRKLIDKLLQ